MNEVMENWTKKEPSKSTPRTEMVRKVGTSYVVTITKMCYELGVKPGDLITVSISKVKIE